jgi:hypothetical protein
MPKIIDVLRLKHDTDLSYEKIAKACGLFKGDVSKYLSLAAAKGIEWPLPEGMDEAQLQARLFPTEPRMVQKMERVFSSRFTIVKIEHPPKAFATMYGIIGRARHGIWL